jgi:2-polyprenyl-3-methyl-5-hydroxy-6-metoxy-1,4-benzoquinol methylase
MRVFRKIFMKALDFTFLKRILLYKVKYNFSQKLKKRDLKPNYEHRIQLIMDELRPSYTVLDVGCIGHTADSVKNPNWLHGLLYGKVKHVIGIDILESEVKKLLTLGYNVIVCNAEDLRLEEKVDVIIAGELIEHLSNPGKFLENVKTVLKEGGKLIITTPNAYSILNIISAITRGYVPVHKEHKCFYDKVTLIQLLNNHGFEIIKFKYVKAPVGARGWLLSHLLFNLGLEHLGGVGLFVVACQKRSSKKLI